MATEYTRDMLFGGKKQEEENINSTETSNKIMDIEIDKLVDFKEGQPFSMYNESKLEQMKESIKLNGILSPIIVRAIKNNKYEIISGHNRVKCSRELELTTIPATVIECDNDNARLIMLDSNLCQRDDILPVEKGFAYKLQLETIKKIREKQKTENADNDSNINGLEVTAQIEQEYSIEQLSKMSDDSRASIQRLIRLTELIKPFQDKVNSKDISVNAGVELSHIDSVEQENINKVIDDNNLKLTIAQAEVLRATKGELTEDEILNILTGKNKKKKEPKFTGKIKKVTLRKYKDRFTTDDDFDTLIDKLLEEYFKNEQN